MKGTHIHLTQYDLREELKDQDFKKWSLSSFNVDRGNLFKATLITASHTDDMNKFKIFKTRWFSPFAKNETH